ncbi:hypothetical protein NDU88_001845 [Pleurodeles waltl]|uniref:Uncharacterized protein n=1 Tax=Pleurodeles waltl TaxID=8319 RepID=A0AAV7U7M6_PLEWA|nr:hypothetical protein NDU88_001845 [Pleurodeles waltl]
MSPHSGLGDGPGVGGRSRGSRGSPLSSPLYDLILEVMHTDHVSKMMRNKQTWPGPPPAKQGDQEIVLIPACPGPDEGLQAHTAAMLAAIGA